MSCRTSIDRDFLLQDEIIFSFQNATSRSMLQIGLSGLLTYVKASQRSSIINELLLSKDYISEIITMAADHFPTVRRFSSIDFPFEFSHFRLHCYQQRVCMNVC